MMIKRITYDSGGVHTSADNLKSNLILGGYDHVFVL